MPATTERYDYSSFTYTNLKVVGSGSFGVVYKVNKILKLLGKS